MRPTSPGSGADESMAARTAEVEALKSQYAAALAGLRQQIPQHASPQRSRSLLARLLLHALNLLMAAAALAAYFHFDLQGKSTAALVSLAVAGVLAFAPIRALLGELLRLESRALHLAHGVGALALGGLALGGYVSGGTVLPHAALAPFQIMGAAQAIMHQQHPRNAQQAEALRRFATSLPEVEQFTRSGSLSSPDNLLRAGRVLSDLLAKAQALGQTELEADPGFQSALARTGLTLGLDSIHEGIDRLAAQPGTSAQVADLRRRLAQARQTLARR